MRALRFERYGTSDVLRVEDVSEPLPRPGEAKVRVRTVSLNPLDGKVRAGDLRFIPLFRGPPRGLGCDFAGEIVGIGGGATERHVGERVLGSLLPFARDGALADFILVAYDRLLAHSGRDRRQPSPPRCRSPAARRCRRWSTRRASSPASAC